MLSEVEDIKVYCETCSSEFKEAISNTGPTNITPEHLESLRIEFLGKKGKVTQAYAKLRNVPSEGRKDAGQFINSLKETIESTLTDLKKSADKASLSKWLEMDAGDLTLPIEADTGSLHPVTLMRTELLEIFRQMGFSVCDGPEVDSDFYNFSALNFPADHPARDMQDTFFVEAETPTVLRTHTSNIQIHTLLDRGVPCRVVAPGRTFRCDSDLTHTPMFHQLEALVADRKVSMADMKGVIDTFLKRVYGSDIKTRFRPSFFPFVEPGAEIDVQCVSCRGKGCRICSETGWLEIGGCGMVHPNVFEAADINSENTTGFAFGFGIDRMAMLRYSLGDLRQLFEGQSAFLKQFPIFGL